MCVDMLRFKFDIEIKKEFKNISKHKRVLMSFVVSSIQIYINDLLLDEDEYFDVDIFFKTLINQGKYPLFTCACGVFGCGGYYVDVIYNNDGVIWLTEQSPFMDKNISNKSRFIFSWKNVTEFAEKLVNELEIVNNILSENGQEVRFTTDKYRNIVESRKMKL